jgi:hypothetical protein
MMLQTTTIDGGAAMADSRQQQDLVRQYIMLFSCVHAPLTHFLADKITSRTRPTENTCAHAICLLIIWRINDNGKGPQELLGMVNVSESSTSRTAKADM